MFVDLPNELREAIRKRLQGVSPRQLSKTTKALSDKYRTNNRTEFPVARTMNDVLAYAAYRMPATYAAATAALMAAREQLKDCSVRTALDLGAGVGSGLWAVSSVWPHIKHITAIDAEASMISVGRELAGASSNYVVRSAEWVQSDLFDLRFTRNYDLVLISYVLGELNRSRILEVIDSAWDATSVVLVIIEPGTPAGYGRVSLAGNGLVEHGGYVVAPCPASPECAIDGNDWCHFSVRLPRTEIHRVAKGAALGYEDEKFSYVVVSRTPMAPTYSRILRHPQVRRGHVILKLCTHDGPKTVTISKRDGKLYNRARKASWGDIFEFRL